MIVLYILVGLLALIALVLLLPVSLDLRYKEELDFKVKFAGIRFSAQKKKKEKEVGQPTKDKKDNQFKAVFKKLKRKKGFTGAIKEIFIFLRHCLEHLGYLLKTMKFKKVCLDLNIVGDDAAKTAIQYGEVCSVAYPVLSFFQSVAKVKYKKIDVKSDFEAQEGSFTFSLTVNMQIIFLIISAFRIYKEYKKFMLRNGL